MARRGPRTGTPADYLIVGLGNPGTEFTKTRHNLGAEVVELLVARHGGRLRTTKEHALADEIRIGEHRVALAVPATFVNESGQATQALVHRYGTEVSRLVVVHDELDLPTGELRVKAGGGLAGHNGLRSIKQHLHDDGFVRVRIGIGKPARADRGADHVLNRFSKRERAEIDVALGGAADAVELIVDEGVDAAMNRFNARS